MVSPYKEEPTDATIDSMVESVRNSVQPIFLTLPKGTGYIERDRFEQAYETLVEQTDRFTEWNFDSVWNAYRKDELVFIVVRTILALTPPELEDLAREEQDVDISHGAARRIDGEIRRGEDTDRQQSTEAMIRAMLETAVEKIAEPTPDTGIDVIHRFDLVDRQNGLQSIRKAHEHGIYHNLLRERYLGRPFASHVDSVSDERGNVMEDAVKDTLEDSGIPFVEDIGFDSDEQEADIYVPNRVDPAIVIEAKIANDGGTMRDKAARVSNLVEQARREGSSGERAFQVVACVDGRGFSERYREAKELIENTRGKVFTFETLDDLVEYTDLSDYAGTNSTNDQKDLDGFTGE